MGLGHREHVGYRGLEVAGAVHSLFLLICRDRFFQDQAMDAGTAAAKTVAPLAYHRRLVEHFQKTEKGLWQWFASSERRADEAESLRLELLKSTYRLDADAYPALFQAAGELQTLLGMSATISIYQMQIGEGFNASLSFLPGVAHIVLAGPVLTLLSAEELTALLAHELAHYLLFSGWDGEFLVASALTTVSRPLSDDGTGFTSVPRSMA